MKTPPSPPEIPNEIAPLMRIIFAAVLLAITVSANAAITADVYEKMKNNPAQSEWIKAYVWGIGAAYESINVDIEVHKKGPRLYCPPEALPMNADNYVGILETRLREIAKMKKDMPFMNGYIALIEAELRLGLQQTFPCK